MPATINLTHTAVRDRAVTVLTRQGVDPMNVSHTLWAAAVETARTELRVEAFRAGRAVAR